MAVSSTIRSASPVIGVRRAETVTVLRNQRGRVSLLDGSATSASRTIAVDPADLIDVLADAQRLQVCSPAADDTTVAVQRKDLATQEEWLASAFVALADTSDVAWISQLASAMLSHITNGPVTVAKRWGRSHQSAGPTLVNLSAAGAGQPFEILLAEDEDGGSWYLALEPGGCPLDQWTPATTQIVGTLTDTLLAARAQACSQSELAAVRSLSRAAGAGDAATFVATLNALVHGNTRLLDPAGQLIAGTPEPTDALLSTQDRGRTLMVRDNEALLAAIEFDSGLPTSPEFDATLVNLTRALLTCRRSITDAQSMRTRLAVIGCVAQDSFLKALAGNESGPGDTVASRLAVIGLGRAASRERRRRAVHELTRAAREDGLLKNLDVVDVDGTILAIYPDEERADARAHVVAWTALLANSRTCRDATVAIGQPAASAEELKRQRTVTSLIGQLQESQAAYLSLPKVALVEELGPVTDTLIAASGGRITYFIERVLGDLLSDNRFRGQLIETLYAYLHTGGSPTEASEMLHLHVSTVKYRVRAIRDILGSRLDDPTYRFELELAVRLYLAATSLQDPVTGRALRLAEVETSQLHGDHRK